MYLSVFQFTRLIWDSHENPRMFNFDPANIYVIYRRQHCLALSLSFSSILFWICVRSLFKNGSSIVFCEQTTTRYYLVNASLGAYGLPWTSNVRQAYSLGITWADVSFSCPVRHSKASLLPLSKITGSNLDTWYSSCWVTPSWYVLAKSTSTQLSLPIRSKE